jgi:hypothetical protein
VRSPQLPGRASDIPTGRPAGRTSRKGFHNKMETIIRQAYGFRNFENYRQRVQVLCA